MVKKGRTHGNGLSDCVFTLAVIIILTFSTLIVIFPIIHVLSASFSSLDGIISGVYFWPKGLSLEGYNAIFKHSTIMRGYLNTIIYVVIGATLNTVLTLFASYPLSRKKLAGRNIIMVFFTITMIFSGGLIPTYIVTLNLKLVDTMWALILVDAISVWTLIVACTFFKTTIPEDLYDAASIDGCNDIIVFTNIVIPLSKAIIAVCLLTYSISYWNSYFNAVVYLHSETKYPLQLILRNILLASQMDFNVLSTINIDVKDTHRLMMMQFLLKYSCIVVSSAPILCLYPFLQKYFVKGVMIGSIKG